MSEVTIGKVDFKAGDPCRPRYVDLYHDQEPFDAPQVQVEPAYQVGDGVEELRIRVELGGGNVEFTDEGGHPLCRELNHPKSQPRIEYDGPSACILTWSRGKAHPATRVFRIYCHRRGVDPKDETDEVKVYGGIFVAVTTSLSIMRRHIPHALPDPVKLRKVVVIGTDPHGRPVYDVFKQRQIEEPAEVELAPAFRAREGMSLEFSMIMGIEYASWNGNVEYIQPNGKPPAHLQGDYDPKYPKQYHFNWQNPGRGCVSIGPLDDCFLGQIVTFHLEPRLDPIGSDVEFPWSLQQAGFEGWGDYALALQEINVDPTIIQPPPCDPVYRVCAD